MELLGIWYILQGQVPPQTLGAKPYFRGAEILNFRRISAPFAPYFRQISVPRKF
jgi:hypothetical protein